MILKLQNLEDLALKGVYAITNTTNNKVYIGSTMRNFKERYITHRKLLRGNRHYNTHLQNAFNKSKEHLFEFSIIEVIEDISIIRAKEAFYINKFNTCDNTVGYNATSTTNSPALDIQVAEKISSTLKKKYKEDTQFLENFKSRMQKRKGVPSWNKGIKCPQISVARRNMFDKIEVLDINMHHFHTFNSMIELIEYSENENNDLPMLFFNGKYISGTENCHRQSHKFLRKDKVYLSIRTGVPYKGLFFKKVPLRSDS